MAVTAHDKARTRYPCGNLHEDGTSQFRQGSQTWPAHPKRGEHPERKKNASGSKERPLKLQLKQGWHKSQPRSSVPTDKRPIDPNKESKEQFHERDQKNKPPSRSFVDRVQSTRSRLESSRSGKTVAKTLIRACSVLIVATRSEGATKDNHGLDPRLHQQKPLCPRREEPKSHLQMT
uniref:Uncharacterized protein n=1 Tax=Populus trichocarpa TaxID=3694 RepID=A0A2K1X4C5_POPTR